VFTIFLPPLRERRSDILLLAEHFLEKYEQEHGKRIRRISTPAIDMLMAYHFPGNVRELENAIERAVLVCDANVIHGHHLPPTLQTAEVSGTVTNLTLKSAVEAFEKAMIQDTLKSTRGNIAQAARQLDSTERILAYKIRNYGIDTRRFESRTESVLPSVYSVCSSYSVVSQKTRGYGVSRTRGKNIGTKSEPRNTRNKRNTRI
jgi:Nif-specific regulatory protein